MKTLTIEQARAAIAAGGISSANLKPLGSVFTLEFETQNGSASLIATVSKQVRRFGNPLKAFEIVHALGLEGGHFSLAQWQPQERSLDKATRPDKAEVLRATHAAATLKRLLDERLHIANDSDAIWHDADDVFAEIETTNAT